MVPVNCRNIPMGLYIIKSRENDTETLIFLKKWRNKGKKGCLCQDLNPGPVAQKSSALPIELSGQTQKYVKILAI